MVSSILAYAVSTSLFVSDVGAEALPQFYVLLGIISVPTSGILSWAMERYPRFQIFRLLLSTMAIATLLLWLLVTQTDLSGYYYAISISFSLVDLMVYILLWTIVADYFTALELKRVTVLLQMANTAGSFVGGLLVQGLAALIPAQHLLLALPPLFGTTLLQIRYLEQTESAIHAGLIQYATEAETVAWFKNLRTFPKLLQRYPIISALMSGMFLSTLLWQLSEFQFLQVYALVLPDPQSLAQFLGLLGAGLSLLELSVAYFITRPLIQHWGVDRMNLLYPLTTLVSFIGLALGGQLPAAIVANFNYDTLSSSVNQPVQNLNYNTVPPRFVGRVRAVIDGICYPMSQAIAGSLLLLYGPMLTFEQLAIAGISLSLIYLGVGYLTGRSYVGSLLARLRSGSLRFQDVREGLARLPAQYDLEIRQLLTSTQVESQQLGLELAARSVDPSAFLDEAQTLLIQGDPAVHQSVVHLLSTGNRSDFQRYLRTQMVSESALVRAVVLEALIASNQILSDTQLLFFLEDPDPGVRGLACVAVLRSEWTGSKVQRAYERVCRSALPDDAWKRMIRLAKDLKDRRLIPLIVDVLEDATPDVRWIGLEALALLASPQDSVLVPWAEPDLSHPDPKVRAAALKLMHTLQPPDLLKTAVMALSDPEYRVSRQAALTVAAYGEASLPVLQTYLNAANVTVARGAIAAIGSLHCRAAEEMLQRYLQPEYRRATLLCHWQQQITQSNDRWQPLVIALRDYQTQLLDLVLYVLTCLGHDLLAVKRRLRSPDAYLRANAVEVLLSQSYRRFLQPLLPLLEQLARIDQGPLRISQPVSKADTELLQNILVESRFQLLDPEAHLDTRWIRIAALLICASEAHHWGSLLATGLTDPDLIVRAVTEQRLTDPFVAIATRPLIRTITTPTPSPIAVDRQIKEGFVNRLFFLKQVPLLESLSLDDLLLIDVVLTQQEFLAGEVIFHEGQMGNDFHILFLGQVKIIKRVRQGQRELALLKAGQYFGEMALFDNAPRSATAIAETDCTLLTLQQQDFQNLVSQRPEIVTQICKTLSLRLRETMSQLE